MASGCDKLYTGGTQMKLRNKKTGEIIDIYKGEITLHYNQGRKTIHFKCLEDLEEWEDYEEPKEYWYIDYGGGILCGETDNSSAKRMMESMGNCFESMEEAEKAVEKLKAWKRLKDNGYKFNGIGVEYDDYKIYLKCDIMKKEHYTPTQDLKDLDLLFGGEE